MNQSRLVPSVERMAFALSICLLLASCAGPDILVLRDQYWKTVGFDTETEGIILELSAKQGKKVRYGDIDYPADVAALKAVISTEEPRTVVLSPLFSRFAKEISEDEKPLQVVSFGLGSDGTPVNDNLTIIVINRTDAYRRAGELCRRYLQYPGNDSMRIAALFYSGGNERTAEREAFERGVGSELAERYYIKSFPRLNELAEVNDYLSGIEGQAIGIFVVSLAGLNREAVSSIVTRYQSLVISERLTGTGGVLPYHDRILATIDENWVEIFSFNLSNAGPEIVVETSLSPGETAFSALRPWASDFFNNDDGE